MRRWFLAALAAFFISATAARAEQCWQRDEAVKVLEGQAAKVGGPFATFPHDKSEQFLDVVNKTGDPTDYHADEIIVIFVPQSQQGLVFLVNKGCADPGPITIGRDVLRDALKAAHQVGV